MLLPTMNSPGLSVVFHWRFPYGAGLLVLLFLAALPRIASAGTFTDDFNRPDSQTRDIGSEWMVRGDCRLINGTLELLPSPNEGGQGAVEAISKTAETRHGEGESFEMSVDFRMPAADSDGRVGLIFNWQSASEFNTVYFLKSKLVLVAIRGGSGAFAQQQPLQMDFTEGEWYRLKVRSSDSVTVEYSISTTGADSQVLDSVSTALPEPPLTGGYGGVMNATTPIPVDNFTLTTAP